MMVGHKTSVNKVKHTLQEVGVSQVACTEFCQGHTTRSVKRHSLFNFNTQIDNYQWLLNVFFSEEVSNIK